MKIASVSSFLLLALLVALFPCKSASNVIDETCKKTTKYDLCVLTLNSNPQSASVDPKGLGIIALQILQQKVYATYLEALDRFRTMDGGTALYQIYFNCMNDHKGAFARLIPNALNELDANKFSDAQRDASRVKLEAEQCEAEFAMPNPLTPMNNEVGDLSTVAADIIGTLG